MAKSFDIIGYTADAAVHCPRCAEKIYGTGALGKCPECRHFTFTKGDIGMFECPHCEWKTETPLLDGEGNPVHPIFVDNEGEWPDGLNCGQCGDEIIPPPESDDDDDDDDI